MTRHWRIASDGAKPCPGTSAGGSWQSLEASRPIENHDQKPKPWATPAPANRFAVAKGADAPARRLREQNNSGNRVHAIAVAGGWPILITLLLGILAPGPDLAAQRALRIAATVNEEIISAYDLENRVQLAIVTSRLPNNVATRKRIAPRILRILIDEKLRLQEAKRLGIIVGEKEIEKAVRSMEKRAGLPEGGIKRYLAKNGIDRSILTSQIEADLAWVKVVGRSTRTKINIGEEAIDEAIRQMAANRGKPEYFLAEIFLPFNSDDSETKVRNMAERLVRQLRSGADFAAVASTFSRSPSAASGGNLGWVRSDQIDSALAEVLVKLGPGKLSSPIKASDGYYLLYLRNRRLSGDLAKTPTVLNMQQLFLPLPAKPSREAIQKRVGEAAAATRRATTCADMEALGKALRSPRSGKLSNVKLTDLPESLRAIVGKLRIGQPSMPVRTQGGVLVLMVCEKRGGGPDPKLRRRIENLLKSQKAELIARRVLRNLRRTAFIDIRR